MRAAPLIALGALGLAALVERFLSGRRIIAGHAASHAEYWLRRNGEPRPDDALVWVVLGDSAAQGVGVDDPADGYVGQLATRLGDRLGRDVAVINLSVSGSRAQNVTADQLPQLQRLRGEGLQPDLVTCVIGGNDMIKPGYSRETYRTKMAEIAAALPAGSVLGEPPWMGFQPWISRARLGAADVRAAAQEHGHAVAPLFDLGREVGLRGLVKLVAADYFHPNREGYTQWADAIWRGIEQSGQFARLVDRCGEPA